MSPTYEELTAELKSLKKRLYTFKLKGLELQQRARSHMSFHRMAAASDDGDNLESGGVFGAFGLQPQSTPLSNEYILEMIASFLPLRDLRTCRLVCQLWSKEFYRCETKRKSVVVAYENDSEDVEALVKEKQKGNIVTISTLIVLSTSLECAAVRQVVLHFGNTISSLRLDECLITSQELYSLLKYLPHLDDFTVKKSDLISQRGRDSPLDQITSDNFIPKLILPYLRVLCWEDRRTVKAIQRLSQMCPNLIYLKISNLGVCEPELLQDADWNGLKILKLKLSYDASIQLSQLQALKTFNFKLKKVALSNVLDFNCTGGSGRMRMLQRLLENSNETLEHVKLFYSGAPCSNFRQHTHVPFPLTTMSCLQSVTVDLALISSLHFVDNLPTLEKLVCKCDNWMNWWRLLCKSPSPKVHPLVNEVQLGSIDSDCLKKISELFPNINSLEIEDDCVDDKCFRVICCSFQKLRFLNIMKSGNVRKRNPLTDYGITGIPEEYTTMLLSAEIKTSLDQYRVQPYIGDLKDLETIEIGRAPYLTDVSVLYGFSKLQSLNFLNLPKCKVTDGCFDLNMCPDFIYSSGASGSRKIRRNRNFNTNASNALINFLTLRRNETSSSMLGHDIDHIRD